jgi:hypothetical protein
MKIKTIKNVTIIDFEGATILNTKEVENGILLDGNVHAVNIDTIIGKYKHAINLDTRNSFEPVISCEQIVMSKDINNSLKHLIKRYNKKSFRRWLILKLM